MKIKLTVSYDGTNYCGWQIQNNGVSVQSVLQDAVYKLTGEKVTVTGSGRTDAGVHAEGQVAHFSIEKATIPPEKYALALNPLLPPDVKVQKSEMAKDDFDARKSAKRKTYRYSFYVSQTEKPLKERYSVRLDKMPDLSLLEKGANVLVGEHDFACFNASGGGAKTTVRTIYDISIKVDGQDLSLYFTGNGFLYNMVRTASGTLLDVGYGKTTVENLAKIVENKDRLGVGRTLPAKGLCLVKVEYGE